MNIFINRIRYGAFETLFNELQDDRELSFKYTRMTSFSAGQNYKETNFRKAVPASLRLL